LMMVCKATKDKTASFHSQTLKTLIVNLTMTKCTFFT
jgi:hypothetical protein